MSVIFDEMSDALQKGKVASVEELVEKALNNGLTVKDILEKGLLAAMDIIADKFKKNEVFLPNVLMAARAMNAGTALLKPHMPESGAYSIGKAILGTVKGDLHDIGKNLVRMMFEGKGIEVVDLGIDVEPEKFSEAFHNEKPDIVAMSALLSTTMGEMKKVVNNFVNDGIRDKVIIMIGGAPVTDNFKETIGADIYAPDAASAADAAKQAILAKKK